MKFSIVMQKDGRITFPKRLRDLQQLTPATKVRLKVSGDSLYITKIPQNLSKTEAAK
jgi:bifunctional DNA-binding transcriptional regulator/antitoxin component of YhaV-PrlF toxin-antitoxin module